MPAPGTLKCGPALRSAGAHSSRRAPPPAHVTQPQRLRGGSQPRVSRDAHTGPCTPGPVLRSYSLGKARPADDTRGASLLS